MSNNGSNKDNKTKRRIIIFLLIIAILIFLMLLKGCTDKKTLKEVISFSGPKYMQFNPGQVFDPNTITIYIDGKAILARPIVDLSGIDYFKVGEYPIILKYIDEDGKEIYSEKRYIEIKDKIAPEILLIGSKELTIAENTIYEEKGYIVTDNYDKSEKIKVEISGQVDTSEIGIYEIVYIATDTSGNTSRVTRKITVEPSIKEPEGSRKPVGITTIVLKGTSTVYVEYPTAYIELGAIATDTVDGDITGKIIVGKVGTSTLGTTKLIYSVTNSSGKTTTATRTVIVRDTTAPVIKITDETVNVEWYSTITDIDALIRHNVTAQDNYDKDVTNEIAYTLNKPFDIKTKESYIVTYTVKDSNNNDAIPKTRVINVQETVNPVGTANYSIATITKENVTVTITTDKPINTPAGWAKVSDTQFTKLYSSNLTEVVTIETAGGLISTVNVSVGNIDKVAPIITLNGDETVTHKVDTAYTDLGATAEDGVDGSVAVTNDSSAAVNANLIGEYTVTYTATDAAGNIATKTRTVIVIASGDPVLQDNMIPIKWSGTTWVKADKTNTSNDWYDYDNFKWANIVLVTDSNREAYKSADLGTIIEETDILAYYVWIPRYKYKLFNVNNEYIAEQEIEVVFENKNTPKSTGTTNGNWLTHPAFTFGTTELNGIWVGKFETSAEPGSTCVTTPNVTNCDVTTPTPRVKPNVDSWRTQKTSNMFEINKKFKSESLYGLSDSNIDSHMMKNMEWGAVAYLSQSKYGKYMNPAYTGANREIYINNYRAASGSKTLTGCSSGTPTAAQSTICASTYNVEGTGTGASTTGTIYGIYDMNGGSIEYVMGVMYNSENTTLNVALSGFTQSIIDGPSMQKYIDKYNYGTSMSDYTRGILGDATREILKVSGTSGGWNHDNSYFVQSTNSWISRGGNSGGNENTGIFNFYRGNGTSNATYSSRSVLVNE